jgi:DnaJ-domain-containing protein 1
MAVAGCISRNHTPAVSRRRKEIPVARTRVDEAPKTNGHTCHRAGCDAPAEFRAPKSPQALDEHNWFCLEHIQEFNRSWNYFQDMSPEDAERYRVEAVTGHRPTWKLGERGFGHATTARKRDPFGFYAEALGENEPETNANSGRPLDPKQRKALAELDLNATATLQEVKMRYKQLVKRYHPDANGGDKGAEERFKTINEAYTILMSSGLS